MSFEARLKEMGVELPPPFDYPSSNRTGCVQAGHLLYSSGHPPPEDFGVVVRGKVGGDVSEEDAVASARATSMNILASVRRQLHATQRASPAQRPWQSAALGADELEMSAPGKFVLAAHAAGAHVDGRSSE